MRTTWTLPSFALAVAACVYSPDPRKPSVDDMKRSTFGSWIVVTDRHGAETHGELIALDQRVVRVLAWGPAKVLGPPGLVVPRRAAPRQLQERLRPPSIRTPSSTSRAPRSSARGCSATPPTASTAGAWAGASRRSRTSWRWWSRSRSGSCRGPRQNRRRPGARSSSIRATGSRTWPRGPASRRGCHPASIRATWSPPEPTHRARSSMTSHDSTHR